MEVVVLAAGQGKRMRSVLPKVLQPIAGKPMLAHILDELVKIGVTDAVAGRAARAQRLLIGRNFNKSNIRRLLPRIQASSYRARSKILPQKYALRVSLAQPRLNRVSPSVFSAVETPAPAPGESPARVGR